MSQAILDPIPINLTLALPQDGSAMLVSQWKQAFRANPLDPLLKDVKIIKGNQHIHQTPQTKDAISQLPERSARAVISTGDVDRERDTIAPAGWDLTDYNGTVLYGHNYNGLPIGDGVDTGVVNERLLSTTKFVEEAENPLAESIYRLVKRGTLNRTSVGFQALESVYNELRNGFDFLKQRLLEYSWVPVPALPQAQLLEAKSAGINMEPLLQYYIEQLDMLSGEPVCIVPRHVIEICYRTLAPATVINIPAGHMGDQQIVNGLRDLTSSNSHAKSVQHEPLPVVNGVEAASLIFPKGLWADEEEARQWVVERGYDASRTAHTGTYWQFPLAPEGRKVENAQVFTIAGSETDPYSNERMVMAYGFRKQQQAQPQTPSAVPTPLEDYAMTMPNGTAPGGAPAAPITFQFDPSNGQVRTVQPAAAGGGGNEMLALVMQQNSEMMRALLSMATGGQMRSQEPPPVATYYPDPNASQSHLQAADLMAQTQQRSNGQAPPAGSVVPYTNVQPTYGMAGTQGQPTGQDQLLPPMTRAQMSAMINDIHAQIQRQYQRPTVPGVR